MANEIALGKTYVPLLDEKYAAEAKTSILDANEELVRVAENGKDFYVPVINMDGLAQHTRGGEYVEGDVSLEWKLKSPDYDRSRQFNIDAMDNLETSGIAYGRLAGEFIRTKVAPEVDAVRFAKYSAKAGTSAEGTISDAKAFLDAVATASVTLDEAEVPEGERILFATSSLLTPVMTMETYKSKEILSKFTSIVTVPQTRFYTAVELNDGKTSGQEAGGYKKASTGTDINFIIVHIPAIIQTLKHVAPKIVTPEQNQKGDNWMYSYRIYGVNEVFDNKVKGIYVHKKAKA